MTSNRKILVVGSINTDMVVKIDHLPAPGETVSGGSFYMHTGGKGANQAVAAARLGAGTRIIAKTGNDLFGKQAIDRLQEEGVGTELIIRDPLHPSGIALIFVDAKGENSIAVAPGTNAQLTPDDISAFSADFSQADVILLQLEIPLSTIDYVLSLPRKPGSRLILNPAPAAMEVKNISSRIDILTPNQLEAGTLTGITVNDRTSAAKAAGILRGYGVQTVVITLGAEGALLADLAGTVHVPAPEVEVLDTTGAGDVFNGALAFAIATDCNMIDAVTFACKAASFSVTRLGAQQSAPRNNEVFSTLKP